MNRGITLLGTMNRGVTLLGTVNRGVTLLGTMNRGITLLGTMNRGLTLTSTMNRGAKNTAYPKALGTTTGRTLMIARWPLPQILPRAQRAPESDQGSQTLVRGGRTCRGGRLFSRHRVRIETHDCGSPLNAFILGQVWS